MNILVFLLIVFVVLVLLIALLRKIKGALITLVTAAALLIGFVSYVLAVPTSSVSIWVTQNVASAVTIDSANKYDSGDVIYKWDIYSVEEKAEEGTTDTDDIPFSQFLKQRIDKALQDMITNDADKAAEYSMTFKDAKLNIELATHGGVVVITKN